MAAGRRHGPVQKLKSYLTQCIWTRYIAIDCLVATYENHPGGVSCYPDPGITIGPWEATRTNETPDQPRWGRRAGSVRRLSAGGVPACRFLRCGALLSELTALLNPPRRSAGLAARQRCAARKYTRS